MLPAWTPPLLLLRFELSLARLIAKLEFQVGSSNMDLYYWELSMEVAFPFQTSLWRLRARRQYYLSSRLYLPVNWRLIQAQKTMTKELLLQV
jgi:hypothetical protein